MQAPGSPTLQIFDRQAKFLQKERAATAVQTSRQADYLKDEVAARLSERLLVCCRDLDWLFNANGNPRTSIAILTMFLTSGPILVT